MDGDRRDALAGNSIIFIVGFHQIFTFLSESTMVAFCVLTSEMDDDRAPELLASALPVSAC